MLSDLITPPAGPGDPSAAAVTVWPCRGQQRPRSRRMIIIVKYNHFRQSMEP